MRYRYHDCSVSINRSLRAEVVVTPFDRRRADSCSPSGHHPLL
jgi:hypothetical protein